MLRPLEMLALVASPLARAELRKEHDVDPPDLPAEQPSESGSPVEQEQKDEELICARCEAAVSSERQLFTMRAETVLQVFPDPTGRMREIMTLRRAWSITFEDWSSTEWTWFAGYAWRIAYCGSCGAHLGWRFEVCEGGGEPAEFYGLLSSAVVRRDLRGARPSS